MPGVGTGCSAQLPPVTCRRPPPAYCSFGEEPGGFCPLIHAQLGFSLLQRIRRLHDAMERLDDALPCLLMPEDGHFYSGCREPIIGAATPVWTRVQALLIPCH